MDRGQAGERGACTVISYHVKIDTKALESYGEEVKKKMPGIVKKNALAIQANSAENAPVETGALKNSMQATPDSGGEVNRWEIADGVEYGVHQELGTAGGITAKHFLGNACETQAEKFFGEIKEALKP